MFINKSNTVCNNNMFSGHTIAPMHESMQRLYKIAQAREGIRRQSELALALNESQQAVKNWEARGLSKDGALKAQARFSCDANWLLIDGPASKLPALVAQEPTPIYGAFKRNSPWPFKALREEQFDLLSDEEKEHIERDILLRVKDRATKQPAPARDSASDTAAATGTI